jgi:hypothetical protein
MISVSICKSCMSFLYIKSSSCPSFPELPVHFLLSALPVPALHSPPIQWKPSQDESHHQQRLQWLCKYSSTEQEQADAAEDNWCCNPALVRPFEVGLPDTKNNETEDREEIESVSSNTVECCKSSKTPHNNVHHSQSCIKHHSIRWGVEQADSIVGDKSGQARYSGRAIWKTDSAILAKANLTEEGGKISFFASSVNETARRESGGIQTAKA